MPAELRIGSLFSGIGGLELGLEQGLADMGIPARTIWQVEQDEYAAGILSRHWPDARRFRDVRAVGANNLEPIDLICGGFPCQDLSLAGRRAGLSGERSGLWWEFERIVRELEPRWVVAENVPGLLSADATGAGVRGSAMGAVVGALASSGYSVWWDCIPAVAVGAPHRRDRVFIVAHRADRDGGGSEGDRQPHGAWQQGPPRNEPDRLRKGRGERARRVAGRGAQPELGGASDGLPAGMDREARAVAALAAHPWAGGGEMWPTANAAVSQLGERPESWLARRERVKATGINGNGMGTPLAMAPHLEGAPDRAPWERDVPRLTTDPTDRRDRLRCLGNAVVPQVARMVGQWIGYAILAEEAEGGEG